MTLEKPGKLKGIFFYIVATVICNISYVQFIIVYYTDKLQILYIDNRNCLKIICFLYI